MYTYRAKVIKVVDGDTIDVNIDLGFSVHIQLRVRLATINAPEMRGESHLRGVASKDFLTQLILDKDVILVTKKDSTEKWGRYLATVFLGDVDVNQHMIDSQQATLWT